MNSKQHFTYEEGRISYGDMFTSYISDLVLEIEAIKAKAARNDTDGIQNNVKQINSILQEMMDIKLELAEIHQ